MAQCYSTECPFYGPNRACSAADGCGGYIAPSNADRIRGMSDADLAMFIGAVATKNWELRSLYGGYSAAFDWLRQPAEEADHA